VSGTGEDLAGLAEERTALAWTRTGLSFMVAGVVLLRLLLGSGPVDAGLAAGLVLLGALAWLWGWHASEDRPAVDSALGRAAVRALALGTALVGAVATILLST
jgi:uncharacterized membrane protein YidH (DUF202 family)